MRRTGAALISSVVLAVVLAGPTAPIAQAGGVTSCSGTAGSSTECQLLDDLAAKLTAAQSVLSQAVASVTQAVANVLDVCVRVDQPSGVPTAEILTLVQALRAELVALPQLIQGLLGAALGDLIDTIDALIVALNAPDPPVEPPTTTTPPSTAPPATGGSGSGSTGGSTPAPTGGSASNSSGTSSARAPSTSGGAAGSLTGWSQATGSVAAIDRRAGTASPRSSASPGVRVGSWLTLAPLLGTSGSGLSAGLDLGLDDASAPNLADRAAGVQPAGSSGQAGSGGAGRVAQVGGVLAVILSLLLLVAALAEDVRKHARTSEG